VPAAAVQTGPEGKYVYVVQADGTAVMHPVNSPRNYRQLAVIESGVNPGDRVIVEGQIKVIPNSKVEVARTVPLTAGPQQLAQEGAAADTGGRQ
jgi:multidrug efflux system membrane fusion protein